MHRGSPFAILLFLWYNSVIMKVKNISLTVLVLAVLLVASFAFYATAENSSQGTKNIFQDSDQDGLSDEEEKLYGTDPHRADTDGDGYSDGAEVKSGYDPTKPAPGDKIVTDAAPKTASSQNQNGSGQANSQGEPVNLTKLVSQKVAEISQSSNPEDQQMSLDELQSMVGDSMNSANSFSADSLPAIDKKDLKIKKQNYGPSDSDKAKEKKKEDFINYIAAVGYIMSSNSPEPVTSISDMTSVSTSITQKIVSALVNRDSQSLEDLNKSGDKMFAQLKEVEIPEELVDTHVKALRFALYAKELEKYVPENPTDPLGDIANFGKIEAFISVLSQFIDDVQTDFDKYGVSYDDQEFIDKMKDYGIDINKDDISKAESLLKAGDSATNSDTSSINSDQ